MSFKAAILGLGNIGRSVIRALETVPDAECIGVVRRPTSVGTTPYDLRGVPDFPSFDELLEHGGNPDVVILGLPSRLSPAAAKELLSRGFCTVDSFDIHARIVEVVGSLEEEAHKGRAVAITAAGWDPARILCRGLFSRPWFPEALLSRILAAAVPWDIPWLPAPSRGLPTPRPSPFLLAEDVMPVRSMSC